VTYRMALRPALLAIAALLVPQQLFAAISYTTMSSLYSETFDSFPTDAPNSANIETVYSDGWQDDVDFTASAEDDVSVLGWHLYHPVMQGEGGFSGHQRFRMGTGNSGTGAFYGFALPNAASAEKAIGAVGATTLAGNGDATFMGLQLINDTGTTLNRFTLTFDGEQWRDGVASETLFFDFSTSSTDGSWFSPAAVVTPVSALNFVAPVNAGEAGVDGNVAGRVADITATVTNFTWGPGEELWLRWSDIQDSAGSDDGLAIDNVRFTADNLGVGGTTDISSVQTGLASSPATWSNNQVPMAGNTYKVLSSHTVTVDGAFNGSLLRALPGATVNFNDGGNNAPIGLLVIEDGGELTETATGDFILGNPTTVDTPLGVLELQGDVDLNVGAGETFIIGLALTGAGDMNLQTGAGSIVRLADSQLHEGVIRFNGSGDEFTLEWNRDFGTVEMNSTGDNKFSFLHQGQVDVGTLIFNQPGTVSHATQITTPSSRLVAADALVVNADVTIDLTASYVSGNANSERRLQFQDALTGAGDITVVGMTTDPSSLGAGVGLHEFELGASGEPGTIASDTYSGNITVGGYVNIELRRGQPAASITLNANARFESGHDVTGTLKSVNVGEMVVNSGATLEVGHEDNLASSTGHQVGHLRLVAGEGRSGDLTLNAGSKTALQVNGTADGEFDTIVAEGDIALGGLLELWFNPASTTATANPVYTPVLNDTWVIMELQTTDFDDSGTVDGADLDDWRAAFDQASAGGDADGDGDTDGNDFLAWQSTIGSDGSTGTITGNFADVVSPTEPGSEWPIGLDFDTVVVGNQVLLRLISLPSGIAAVPEPTAALLGAAAAVVGLAAARRRRRS
jgi:hypothetical protein